MSLHYQLSSDADRHVLFPKASSVALWLPWHNKQFLYRHWWTQSFTVTSVLLSLHKCLGCERLEFDDVVIWKEQCVISTADLLLHGVLDHWSLQIKCEKNSQVTSGMDAEISLPKFPTINRYLNKTPHTSGIYHTTIKQYLIKTPCTNIISYTPYINQAPMQYTVHQCPTSSQNKHWTQWNTVHPMPLFACPQFICTPTKGQH